MQRHIFTLISLIFCVIGPCFAGSSSSEVEGIDPSVQTARGLIAAHKEILEENTSAFEQIKKGLEESIVKNVDASIESIQRAAESFEEGKRQLVERVIEAARSYVADLLRRII